jgi:hypothetical protein
VSSVVLELQREALDQSVRVSDLLRRAIVVARKLGLAELQEWIEKELSGYKEGQGIPDYREVWGQIRAWNPYRGWIPVLFEDPTRGERLSKRSTGQSIAEIENILEGSSKQASLHLPFPQEIQRRLCEGMPFETEVTLIVQYSSLIRIVDSVRTIILNWTIKLEEDGILGEDLSFTSKEKHQARTHSYNITNFFGPVQGPQVQLGSDHSVQISATFDFDADAVRGLLGRLRAQLGDLGLSPDKCAEAEAEIGTVDAQLRSPKPKGLIVREGLRSLRSILESAGGGAAAQLLIELGRLLL